MSTGLIRYHQTRRPHFITFSCFRHRPILGTEAARDNFCELLDHTRELYTFDILGYVIMPDHVHLILTEPEAKPLSVAIQILKQRFSKSRTDDYVWEPRYYDFNIFFLKRSASKSSATCTAIQSAANSSRNPNIGAGAAIETTPV